MAHLFPEAARQANRGPVAAVGLVIGLAVVVVAGLTIFAPSGCGPTAFSIGERGVTYLCGDLKAAGGILPIHAIPWLSLGVGSILGAVIGAAIGHEAES
jgi:hypothetical protein